MIKQLLPFALLLALLAQAEEPDFTYHHAPPPKHHFPAIEDFFAYGVYAAWPYPYDERWNAAHLGRSTEQAIDYHYRHLILNDINFFAHNLPRAKDLSPYLELSERYGGKHEFMIRVGHLVKAFTGETRGRVRWPLDRVVDDWTSFVEPYAESPHILYWRIYDEIAGYRDYEQQYIFTLKEKLYEVDQRHPISFIEQGAPSPVTRHLEYGMGECYAYYFIASSGKDLSHAESHLRDHWEQFRHQRVRQCILWAASYGTYRPSPSDVRAEVYHMLAAGWNSLAFYYAPVKAPAWAHWTKHEPFARHLQPPRLIDYGLANNFQYQTDVLTEISRLGRLIIPLGGLFLHGEYQPQHAYTFDCEDALLDRAFEHPETGNWSVERQPEPAIGVGVWQHDGADLLVVYNRDLANPQAGRVVLPEELRQRSVYDLSSMTSLPLDDTGGVKIELETSGGAFLLVATEEAFTRLRADIERRRHEHEANKLRIRLQMDAKLADVQPALRLLEQGDLEGAREARPIAQDISEIRARLEEASDLLWDIDLWLKHRLVMLMAEPEDMGNWTFYPPLGTGRPALDEALTTIRELGARYYPLLQAFEAGESESPAVYTAYVSELQAAKDALVAYRPSQGWKPAVALVATGPDSDEAWTFLSLQAPNSVRVTPDGTGGFTNDAGQPIDLATYDVWWIHGAEPDPATCDAIRAHLAQGNGVLMTGLAPLALDDLGLEQEPPATIQQDDPAFFRPGFKTIRNYQHISLQPAPDWHDHPIFTGLDIPVTLAGDDAHIRTTRASWTYPQVPQSGNVLAWTTTNALPPPDKRHLDLVEFAAPGGGRLLCFGLPKLSFGTRFKRVEANLDRFRNLRLLMGNMINHLAEPTNDFQPQPLTGPFYHRNVASLEENPELKLTTSGGDNTMAPVEQKTAAFYKWNTQDLPAWLELDFGQEVTIAKLHLLNHWISHSSWTISDFRVKRWDDNRQQFVDLAVPLRFSSDDLRRSYQGITFDFAPLDLESDFVLNIAPITTRKLRIEGLRGVLFTDPTNPQENGISLSKLLIYGTPSTP